VAADADGNVYILERAGHALRVVDAGGRIRTVAGTGKAGASGDGGDARRATLNEPKHLCIDKDGAVIIADTDNHVIRKYLPRRGTIVGVAGTGTKGSAGVGGPPEEAELNQPHGVHIGPGGDLYIADSGNHRLGKRDLGTPGDYLTDRMPAVNTLIGGELAWRQHHGGHTNVPNCPAFYEWAGRYIATAGAATKK
jgi:hypothetical protein